MDAELKILEYGSPDYKQTVDLRYKVLRAPLGLQFGEEELKKDIGDIHLALFIHGKPVACLILSLQSSGKIKMRQVAVDGSLQGKGYGTYLSRAAEDYALKKGFSVVYCHARSVAAPFYKKLGYKVVGDEFTEVGIPHYLMEKQLE
jgi:predicted GNAT family N-acyltransferase